MARYCRLFNIFWVFPCKIRDPHVFSHSGIKVMEGFSVISKIAVTTPIAINYSRVDFFSSESLKWNKVLNLHLDLNIIFNLQNGKFLSLVVLALFLNQVKLYLNMVKSK